MSESMSHQVQRAYDTATETLSKNKFVPRDESRQFHDVAVAYRNYLSTVSAEMTEFNSLQAQTSNQIDAYMQRSDYHGNEILDRVCKGVYFCLTLASPGNGAPPNSILPRSSPYGDCRITVPANNVIDSEQHNLYFVNAYVIDEKHLYVVLGIIPKSSDQPTNLKPLAWEDNRFLRVINGEIRCAKAVWVEIFCVFDVPIDNQSQFITEGITYTGRNRVTQ